MQLPCEVTAKTCSMSRVVNTYRSAYYDFAIGELVEPAWQSMYQEQMQGTRLACAGFMKTRTTDTLNLLTCRSVTNSWYVIEMLPQVLSGMQSKQMQVTQLFESDMLQCQCGSQRLRVVWMAPQQHKPIGWKENIQNLESHTRFLTVGTINTLILQNLLDLVDFSLLKQNGHKRL